MFGLLGEKLPLTQQHIDLNNYIENKILLICCILFASDHTCQMPLHILIADIIDKFTSSTSECLRILNRFGLCCTKDSLKRFQTDIPVDMVSDLIYLKDAIQKIKVNILNDKSFYIQNFYPYHFI